MTDIFPQRNLPDQAEAWGREIEDRIKDIGKKVSTVANTTRNTNLVAVKSAEAADHNVRRVEIQVEALEAAVNEKTRAVLDEAIEELREAEIVMEAQFEAHDVSLAEAETAIGSLETDLADAETAIGLLELDLAPGGGTYDRITDALVQAGDAQGAANAAQTAASTAQETADQAAQDAATAQTAASNAATAASTAQDAADQAAQDAADAAGIAASKGDVLIQGAAPATGMRKATTLWIDTTGGTNTPKRWNGSAWVAVTDKAAVDAANAAATAQSTANAAQTAADLAASAAAGAQDTADQAILDAAAAQTAAGNAQTTANAAQTAAAGKSAIYYSTAAPSGTGTRQGDVWFRRDSQGSTIGMWEWTGSSWQSRTLRNEVIANLDAGKITTGYLSTDRLDARSITGDKLVLGSSENLIPNGAGEFGDLGGWASFTNMTGVSWETDDAPPGLPGYVRFDKTGTKSATGIGGLFDVEPGAEYLFEAYIRADVAGSRLYVEFRVGTHASDNYAIPGYPSGNGTGTGNPGIYPIQNREVPTTWTRIVGRTVVRPGVNKMRIGDIYVNHANGTVRDAVVDIAGLRLQKRASAELIVDGAVTADKVAARSITAEKLVISPANVWPDPYFVETGAWAGTDVEMVADPDMPGGTGLRITVRTAQRGTHYRGSSSRFVQVEPGAQYRFRATVKQEGGPDPSALAVYIRGVTADGTLRREYKEFVPGETGPGIFTVDEVLPKLADDLHGGVTVGIYTYGPYREGTVFTVGGASLTRMADSSLIVNGAVTAEKVQAQSVAGAVGVFIDAMMQHLTVTGVAAISQATVDQLYTKMAVVQKLQATESIVTKDMIATGAVTSDKIAAGAVSADMIDIGQNAKWDSTGLVFYAPPQPGQVYDDWENRTPLIQIRPDGSSSVQVGDTAGLHGGITSSGLVYGTSGDFETITVGGRDFATAVSEGPRGVISAVTPSNGMNATTSNGPYLSTKFAPEPGRMYRVTFGFRGGAASTENVIVADFRQARPGASGGGSASRRILDMSMLAARAQSGGATGVTHIDVSGDYLLGDSTYVTDGETVMWIYISTNAGTFYLNGGGSQYAGLPILKIEDIGVAYQVETQTVSSTTPPPPSKVTKTDYIWSGTAVGVRPDGSTALDSRLTLGGYNNFGTDMAEFIWYPFNLSRLNGSTVNEALVQLTITQSYSGGQVAYYMDAATNRLSGRANLSQGWGSPGKSHDRHVPSGNLSRLIGKGGILIAPYNVGQYSSYGYFNSRALLRVKYTK